jgi:hypothetical protein
VVGKEDIYGEGQGDGKKGGTPRKMEPLLEAMGKFMGCLLPSSQQEFCEPSEVLYVKNTPEAMAKSLQESILGGKRNCELRLS